METLQKPGSSETPTDCHNCPKRQAWVDSCGGLTCPQNPLTRLANACKCGDCYHPAFGPDADGDPCQWCRDCGCHKSEHPRTGPGQPA